MSIFDPALLDLRAVFSGFLADIAASAVAGIVFGIAIAADTATDAAEAGAREDGGLEKGFAETLGKPTVGLQILVLSLLASMIGGATAAWLAPEGSGLTNAFAVGLLSTVISSLTLFFDPPTPPWVTWADVALSLPGALVGGWLAGA